MNSTRFVLAEPAGMKLKFSVAPAIATRRVKAPTISMTPTARGWGAHFRPSGRGLLYV